MGQDELVVGLEDLKVQQHKRRPMVRTNEVKEKKEERARARGVLLYLEQRYEQVDEKISNFDSFPEEINVVLDKYINVFDTKLRKSMNVEPVQLNVK